MRIALLTPAYWPEVARGTERFTHDLAAGLAARGHEPRVITSHRARPDQADVDGIPVTRVWRPPRGSIERRHYERYLTHLPASLFALRRGDDELAHATFQTDALVAARWAEATQRRSVFTLRLLPDHANLSARRRRLRSIADAARRCDVTCVPSEAAATALGRWVGARARVISPGVDLDAFDRVVERASEPTIVCTATPDEPHKRLPLLVSAFRSLRRSRPGARLKLVRPAAARDAEELREADPHIELMPPAVDANELAAAYGGAWVTALPSTGDGFPSSLLESLACGTPVVGAARGAAPELIDRDSIGRLFQDGEYELAKALDEALELAEAQGTAAECRKRAEDFPLERCVSSYEALYRELLG